MSSNINALKGIGKYLLLATQVKEVEPFIAYSCMFGKRVLYLLILFKLIIYFF